MISNIFLSHFSWKLWVTEIQFFEHILCILNKKSGSLNSTYNRKPVFLFPDLVSNNQMWRIQWAYLPTSGFLKMKKIYTFNQKIWLNMCFNKCDRQLKLSIKQISGLKYKYFLLKKKKKAGNWHIWVMIILIIIHSKKMLFIVFPYKIRESCIILISTT